MVLEGIFPLACMDMCTQTMASMDKRTLNVNIKINPAVWNFVLRCFEAEKNQAAHGNGRPFLIDYCFSFL